jgi:hypothetical protein
MKLRMLVCVIVCAGLAVGFLGLAVTQADETDPATGKSIYVCKKGPVPCISYEPGGCPACGDTIKPMSESTHNYMKFLPVLAKALKKSLKTGDTEVMAGIVKSIDFVSKGLQTLEPEKNAENTAAFQAHAKELSRAATDMLAASEKNDPPRAKEHFKAFNKTCKTCHTGFK